MLVVHMLALVSIAVCLFAADWQWNRAHISRSVPSTVAGDFETLSPLRQYLPSTSVAALTTVSGKWATESRFELPGRHFSGSALTNPSISARPCSWVVDVLILQDESGVAVVTGCTNNFAQVPPATGIATVTGVLQPSEDSGAVSLSGVPSLLTTKEILRHVNATIHDGYVVSNVGLFGSQKVDPIISESIRAPLNWRNITYVFNWLVFGFIIAAMWFRVVQDLVSESKSN